MKTKIFRNLWRANAVFIFIVGVLSLILLAIGSVHMVRREFRDREVRAVVNTDTTQRIDESLALGVPRDIQGYPWVLVALDSDQTYDQGSYSKSAESVRNYAFVSPTESTRWLFPHNRFLILDATQLPAGDYDSDVRTALISFEVIEKDTNGDKRLTGADAATLVFTRPDGTGQLAVLNDVVGVSKVMLVGEDVMVIYRGSSGYVRAVFSAKDFSKVREDKLEFPAAG